MAKGASDGMHGVTGGLKRSPGVLTVLPLTIALASFRVLAAGPDSHDLADLSLEELTSIEVTSVSKKPERLGDAPASVFVITAEDIRRSGATSLPEALRLAPNLQVARIDSADYAISARGFNNSTGNKLLVLIDGRSVYTPLFSGVFWDVQDLMMEDIDRIEVISGPGGTLWGTNAVNGVINVITRPSKDTQGTLVSAGAGNLESGFALRHGAALGENGRFRMYGKFFDRQNTELGNGREVADDWSKSQLGFRADWSSPVETVTLQGDAYSGDLEQSAPGTTEVSGLNLLGRWSRQLADGSTVRLQGYYDHTERDIPGTFGENLDVLDVELQHSTRLLQAHEFAWGAGYRYAYDRVQNSAVLAFLPANKSLHWENIFAQDTISLLENVQAILGVRLETNVYTGLEVLPSARLAWKVAPERLIWSSVSRAVRAPSRLDRELFVPASPPFAVLAGGPDFQSEIATVTEIGYRSQPSPRSSYSVTAFHHVYDELRSIEPSPSGPVLGNKMKGTGRGVEAWGNVQVNDIWRLSAGGFVLDQDLELEPDSGDTGTATAGNDPDYQAMLRSSLDLPGRVELDVGIRHVAKLPDPEVPAYTALDVRIGWRPRSDVELSLTGQNLLEASHPEFGTAATRSELSRSIYGRILWRF